MSAEDLRATCYALNAIVIWKRGIRSTALQWRRLSYKGRCRPLHLHVETFNEQWAMWTTFMTKRNLSQSQNKLDKHSTAQPGAQIATYGRWLRTLATPGMLDHPIWYCISVYGIYNRLHHSQTDDDHVVKHCKSIARGFDTHTAERKGRSIHLLNPCFNFGPPLHVDLMLTCTHWV